MTALVAGFVNGLFQGMDWREGRDDRKRRRKIEDETLGWDRQRFEWEKGDQAYTEETRGNDREDRAITERDRQRTEKKREAEEAAWNATLDDILGGKPSEAADAPATEPAQPDQPTEVRVPASRVPRTGQPASRLDYGLGVIGAGAGSGSIGGPADDRLIPPDAGGPSFERTGRGGMPPPLVDPVAQAGGKVLPSGYTVAPAPSAAIADELYMQGPAGVRYLPPPQAAAQPPQPQPVKQTPQGPVFEQAGRGAAYPQMTLMDAGVMAAQKNAADAAAMRGPAFEETGRRDRTASERRAIGIRDFVSDTASAMVPDLSGLKGGMDTFGAAVGAPVSAGAKQAAGTVAAAVGATDAGAAAFDSAAADKARAEAILRAQGTAPAAPAGPAPQPRRASAPQATPQAAAAQASRLSYGAPPTAEGTPMVSLSLGKEMGLIGQDGAVKTTAAATDKTADRFVSAYRKEKVPAIVEHYLRNGEIEKAKAFQDWLDEGEVKAGMKAWAKAGHAFSVGDGEKFMDHLAEAYNVRGYADDGYSVNRQKSRLVYADNGDLLGAQIAFVDEANGKEFVQNFEGINDLMAVGWAMLAPEKQFELGWNATIGAKKAEAPKIDPAKIMSAIESRSLTDPAFAALPQDEKERVMVEAFTRMASGGGQAPSEPVPVDPLD